MFQEKPCRVCSDFQSWAKLQKQTFDSEKESHKKAENKTDAKNITRNDCPLDKDELGSKTWAFLHTMAAYYPDRPNEQEKYNMKTFFHIFAKLYPCRACAQDLQDQLKIHPPQTESQNILTQWLCSIHNRVNEKLGKPIFDCTLVNQRWRDGWLDGSCD